MPRNMNRIDVHVSEEASPIEQAACEILTASLTQYQASSTFEDGIEIGTPASSPRIAEMAEALRLGELGDEGFVVQTVGEGDRRRCVIASLGPRGVLYGCGAVGERLQLGDKLDDIALRETPVLSHRNLWAWNGPR